MKLPEHYRVKEGCTFSGQHRQYKGGEQLEATELPMNVERQLAVLEEKTVAKKAPKE